MRRKISEDQKKVRGFLRALGLRKGRHAVDDVSDVGVRGVPRHQLIKDNLEWVSDDDAPVVLRKH